MADFNLSAEVALQLADKSISQLKASIQKAFSGAALDIDADKTLTDAQKKAYKKTITVPAKLDFSKISTDKKQIEDKIKAIKVKVAFDRSSVRELTSTNLTKLIGSRQIKVKVGVDFSAEAKKALKELSNLKNIGDRVTKATPKAQAKIGKAEQRKAEERARRQYAAVRGEIPVDQIDGVGSKVKKETGDVNDLIARLRVLTAEINKSRLNDKIPTQFFESALEDVNRLILLLGGGDIEKGIAALQKRFEGLNSNSFSNLENSLKAIFKANAALDNQRKRLESTGKPAADLGPYLAQLDQARSKLSSLASSFNAADLTSLGTGITSILSGVNESINRFVNTAAGDVNKYIDLINSLSAYQKRVQQTGGSAEAINLAGEQIKIVEKFRASGQSIRELKADDQFQLNAGTLKNLGYVDITLSRIRNTFAALQRKASGDLSSTIGGQVTGLAAKADQIRADALSSIRALDTKDPLKGEKAQDIRNQAVEQINKEIGLTEKLNQKYTALKAIEESFNANGFKQSTLAIQNLTEEMFGAVRAGKSLDDITRLIDAGLAKINVGKSIEGQANNRIRQLERLRVTLGREQEGDVTGILRQFTEIENKIRSRLSDVNNPLQSSELDNIATKGIFDIRQGEKVNKFVENTAHKLRVLGDAQDDLAVEAKYDKWATSFENSAQKIINSSGTITNKMTQLKKLSDDVFIKARVDADGGFFGTIGKAAGLAAKRLGAFLILAQGLYGIQAQVTQAIGDAVKIDKEFVRLEQVITGGLSGAKLQRSYKDLEALKNQVLFLGRSLGIATTEIAASAQVLAQAGLEGKNLAKILDVVAKSQLGPSFASANETSEAAIAIMNQFNLTADQTAVALGGVNRLSAKYAVEAQGITEAVRRAGGVFATAGGNISEFSSAFTIIKEQTREADESIATALRNITQRIQRSSVQKYLRETLNVDLVDNGQFIGFEKAIVAIGSAIKKAGISENSPLFSEIREKLAGTLQAGRITPLLQNYEKLIEYNKEFKSGAKSIDEDVVKAFNSIENKLQRARSAVVELFTEIANNQAVKLLIESFTQLTIVITNMLKVINTLPGAILAIGAAFKAVGPFKTVIQSVVSQFAPRQFNLDAKNSGGQIPGRGPNKDSVLSYLTKGEYVIQRDAVDKYGVDFLDKVNKGALPRNKGGIIPGFNNGGLNDNPFDVSKADAPAPISLKGISGKISKMYFKAFDEIFKVLVTPIEMVAEKFGGKIGKSVGSATDIRSAANTGDRANAKRSSLSTLQTLLNKKFNIDIPDIGDYVSEYSNNVKSPNAGGEFGYNSRKLNLKNADLGLHEIGHAIHAEIQGSKIFSNFKVPVEDAKESIRRVRNRPDVYGEKPSKKKLNREIFADFAEKALKYVGAGSKGTGQNPAIENFLDKLDRDGVKIERFVDNVEEAGFNILKSVDKSAMTKGNKSAFLTNATRPSLLAEGARLAESGGMSGVGGGGGDGPRDPPKGPSGGGYFGKENFPWMNSLKNSTVNSVKGMKGFDLSILSSKKTIFVLVTALLGLQSTVTGVNAELGNLVAAMAAGVATMSGIAQLGNLRKNLISGVNSVLGRGKSGKIGGVRSGALDPKLLGAEKIISRLSGVKDSGFGPSKKDFLKNKRLAGINSVDAIQQGYKNDPNIGKNTASIMEKIRGNVIQTNSSGIAQSTLGAGAGSKLGSLAGFKNISSMGKASLTVAKNLNGIAIISGIVTGALGYFASSVEQAGNAALESSYNEQDAVKAAASARSGKVLGGAAKGVGGAIGGALTGFALGGGPLGAIAGAIGGAILAFAPNLRKRLSDKFKPALDFVGNLVTAITEPIGNFFNGISDYIYGLVFTEEVLQADKASAALTGRQNFTKGRLQRSASNGNVAGNALNQAELSDVLASVSVSEGILKGSNRDTEKIDPSVLEGQKANLQRVSEIYSALPESERAKILDAAKRSGVDMQKLFAEMGVSLVDAKVRATSAFEKLSSFLAGLEQTVDLSSARLSGIEAGFESITNPDQKSFVPTQIFDVIAAGFNPKALGLDQFSGAIQNLNSQVAQFDPNLAKAVNLQTSGQSAVRNLQGAVSSGAIQNLKFDTKGNKEETLASTLQSSFDLASGGDVQLGAMFDTFIESKIDQMGDGFSDNQILATKVNEWLDEFASGLDKGALEQVKRINEINKNFSSSYEGLLKERFSKEAEIIELVKSNADKQKSIFEIQNKASGLSGNKLSAVQESQASFIDNRKLKTTLTNTGVGPDASVAQLQGALLQSQTRRQNAGAIVRGRGLTGTDAVSAEAELKAAEDERQNRLKAGLQYIAGGTETATFAMQEFEKAAQKAAASSKFLTDSLLGTDDQIIDTYKGIAAYQAVSSAKSPQEAQALVLGMSEERRGALNSYIGQNEEARSNFENKLGFGSSIAGGPEAKAAEDQIKIQQDANNALAAGISQSIQPLIQSSTDLKDFYKMQFENTRQIVNEANKTAQNLVNQIANLPSVITHEGNINVNLVGANQLQSLQEGIRGFVQQQINVALANNNQALQANNQGLNTPAPVNNRNSDEASGYGMGSF
jgi:TP901 family phage tail tape measure protein